MCHGADPQKAAVSKSPSSQRDVCGLVFLLDCPFGD